MSALLNRSPLCRLQFIVCAVARRFVFGPAVARRMRNILYLCKSTRAKRAGSFGTWFKVPLYSVVRKTILFVCAVCRLWFSFVCFYFQHRFLITVGCCCGCCLFLLVPLVSNRVSAFVFAFV